MAQYFYVLILRHYGEMGILSFTLWTLSFSWSSKHTIRWYKRKLHEQNAYFSHFKHVFLHYFAGLIRIQNKVKFQMLKNLNISAFIQQLIKSNYLTILMRYSAHLRKERDSRLEISVKSCGKKKNCFSWPEQNKPVEEWTAKMFFFPD